MGEISRVYVDQAGWLNQIMAEVADTVTFIAAGLPLILKGSS
jgi:adenosylcobinamide kinase/adenosylcobinamide-phosphate guanylyltransferase